jgi:hypothetical protein
VEEAHVEEDRLVTPWLALEREFAHSQTQNSVALPDSIRSSPLAFGNGSIFPAPDLQHLP